MSTTIGPAEHERVSEEVAKAGAWLDYVRSADREDALVVMRSLLRARAWVDVFMDQIQAAREKEKET